MLFNNHNGYYASGEPTGDYSDSTLKFQSFTKPEVAAGLVNSFTNASGATFNISALNIKTYEEYKLINGDYGYVVHGVDGSVTCLTNEV